MKNKKGMKSISKFEYGRTRGWYVIIYYKGKWHRKLFSYKKHTNDKDLSGKQTALKQAKKWRNEIENLIGKPHTDTSVFNSSKNNTGKVGIRKIKVGSREYFEVSCYLFGKTKRTKISISKYGIINAFNLAVAKRTEFENKYEEQKC